MLVSVFNTYNRKDRLRESISVTADTGVSNRASESSSNMLAIKGGHVEPRRRHSSDGNSAQPLTTSGTTRRIKMPMQVHDSELLAMALVASGSTSTPDKHGTTAHQFAKRPTSSVRLLSIIALIVILMLSRQCSARPFASGMDGGSGFGVHQDGTSESFAVDRQQQQQLVDVGYVLEVGCRNLVEAMLHPQRAQPKDQRAAMDFMEFVDSERNKRLSPKHTPRFGR